MSRCKACDVIMNEFEMRRIDRATGDYSELCSDCLSASNEATRDIDSPMHTILDDIVSHDLMVERSAIVIPTALRLAQALTGESDE